METICNPREVKSKKNHVCNFCCGKISVGEKYMNSTHVGDIGIYNWKAHTYCSKIVDDLKMYNDCDSDGLTQEIFQGNIEQVYHDSMINLFTIEERIKVDDVIQNSLLVSFKVKLNYVMRKINKGN